MTAKKKALFPFAPIYNVPFLQFGVTLLLGTLALFFGVQQAVSVMVGSFICLASNVVFIWRFFRRENTQSARDLLNDAYQGVFSKMLLTTLMFMIVLSIFKDIEILLLFVGFIGAQSVSWFAPLLMKRKIYK